MNVLQGPRIHVLDVGAISWEEGPFLLHLLKGVTSSKD